MGKALYRKYRPKSLSEVLDQEHITTTLANAIKSGKISHAYLLTGPRGVGKTSIARILAHELNELPRLDAGIHLDIIEIDAASNRRIDEVRDLRDKVHILPTSAKYKVYIIDEVHMLTREAFNALLKTLEEPPEHVVFILATTEAHKLPETIISRTQHFVLKPITTAGLVAHLKKIAKTEKIKIDDAALELVAKHGNGSFRDSISLLDQARSFGDNITVEDIERLLGVAPEAAVNTLQDVLWQGDPKALFDMLAKLRAQGLESAKLATQLSQRLQTTIINDPSFQTPAVGKLLHGLLDVTGSNQADRLIELVLLDHVLSQSTVDSIVQASATLRTKATPKDLGSPAQAKLEKVIKPTKTAAPAPTKTEAAESKMESKQPTAVPRASGDPFTVEAWPVVLAEIKKKYNTLYGILRMAEPSVDGAVLTLACKFSFHQKQINESKNRKIISDIIHAQSGQDVEIKCEVVEKPQAGGAAGAATGAAVSTVSDIFGGAEVLES